MNWKRKIKSVMEAKKVNLRKLVERLKNKGIDIYSNNSSVRKILLGFQHPSLGNPRFLNLLRGIGLNDEQIREVVLGSLSEYLGYKVTKKDFYESRKAPILRDFLVEKFKNDKEKFTGKKIVELGYHPSTFYKLMKKDKDYTRISHENLRRFLSLFGREFIPVYLRTFVSPEYHKLFDRGLS